MIDRWIFPTGRDHDACGVGAVSVGRTPQGRKAIDMAQKAVCNFEHRGACMPDGTGDGTGFLTDIPKPFFARALAEATPGAETSFLDGTGWGVATLFITPSLSDEAARALCEKALASMGIAVALWRHVPLDPTGLGKLAASATPNMRHVLMRWTPCASDELTLRLLFKVQRRLEDSIRAAEMPIYIVSFSDRVLVYKAMAAGAQFTRLFPDLTARDFEVGTVVFHRRFATNTSPNWNMCQPFRLLCHNGEINTIQGNRQAVRTWERYVAASGRFEDDWPANSLIPNQSDSADLDGAVQAYHAEGRSLAYVLAILMPKSWENSSRNLAPEMRAFFEFHKRAMGSMGAWEGPAAILAYDGRQLIASLDRMGLRPLRVSQSIDGTFMAASEHGIFEHNPEQIVFRQQLTPGDLVRFDLETQRIVHSADVYYEILRETAPMLKTTFRDINSRQIHAPTSYGIDDTISHPDLFHFRGRLGAYLRAWGWDSKMRQESTDHLIDLGKEEIYSMGYDRAMPALSIDGPTLYQFFQQRFALVTNPPIDPYREGRDMALVTYLGRMPDVPPRTSPDAVNLRLKSPILTMRTIGEITASEHMPARVVRTIFPAGGSGTDMRAALDGVIEKSLQAAREGVEVVILSDRGCFAENAWPIPAPLAVCSVNDALIEHGLRPLTSIVVQSGEIAEAHDVAVLLSLGATAVHPHALFRYAMERSRIKGRQIGTGMKNATEGLEEGLRKIMSKMGICTIQGYRGSMLFEAVGLGPDVKKYLPGIPSRVGGVDFDVLAGDIAHRVRHAAAIDELPEFDFDERSYNDPMRIALWEVARTGGEREWKRYSLLTESRRPCTIRDLVRVEPPEDVEPKEPLPAQAIMRDCAFGGGMSHGALTAGAHGAIAQAANEIGMLTNSGEGGEDRRRNRTGDLAHMRSRIRQVATGRFGVDAEYLVNADEIQVKMAQGAKPGEGGQLMSAKVTDEIARLRYCRPGIDLISPPPHHDIYSIEDLKQLIYDLRAVNPQAKISVKLCAVTGIGTIAAGVVKAGADIIEIDGVEGSTGASPRSSLQHTGLPTELGLREVHLALTELGLRDGVKLRAGGGVKTEYDAVKYMLMGADQFVLATTLMIAQGCIHCNCCHLGTCPTYIAGMKNPRAVWPGSHAHVKNFLLAFGQGVAELVARLGFSHPEELVGRVDLLRRRELSEISRNLKDAYGFEPERFLQRAAQMDLSLVLSDVKVHAADTCAASRTSIDNLDHSVRLLMEADDELRKAIDDGRPLQRRYKVHSSSSVDFGVGVAGRIARKWGRDGWPAAGTIHLHTTGTGGQSYGAFCVKGMDLRHTGSCNDHVGKGMSGGRIVIAQPDNFSGKTWQTTLVGNTVAFGATGGKLFIQGRGGQRLGVRNSGATIVCEGAGQYACEYMTAGTVVLLGPVGDHIGAGMTDGVAYLYDPDGTQDVRFMIDERSVAISTPSEDELYEVLAALLDEYHEATGSARAIEARQNLYQFTKITPLAAVYEEMKKKFAVDLGKTIAG